MPKNPAQQGGLGQGKGTEWSKMGLETVIAGVGIREGYDIRRSRDNGSNLPF